jgi:hypothetical protein
MFENCVNVKFLLYVYDFSWNSFSILFLFQSCGHSVSDVICLVEYLSFDIFANMMLVSSTDWITEGILHARYDYGTLVCVDPSF